MSALNISLCQFPRLHSNEVSNSSETFQIAHSDVVDELPGLEKALIHAAWIVLLNLYTRNSDITYAYDDDHEPLLTFSTVFNEDTEDIPVIHWIGQLNKDLQVNTPETSRLFTEDTTNAFNTYVSFRRQEKTIEFPPNSELAISLLGWLEDGNLTVKLTFSKNHFQLEQGQLFAEQFVYITNTLLQNLNTSIKSLNWTPANEKSLFLNEWQAGKSDYCKELDDTCIHHLIEHQVEKTPKNIALQFEDKELVTYAELNKRANKFAHFLIATGVGPEDIVAICLEKSINMIITIMAVLKAGASYVPLDPEFPKERVSFIVEDTNAKIIITTTDLEIVFNQCSAVQLLSLDREDVEFSQQPDTNPEIANLKSSNLCYLIFTSGSTGTPKGVMLEHRGVVNYVVAHQKILNLSQNDRFLQFSNYTFDASILDIFVTLTTGSRICLASKNNLLTNLSEMASMMKVTAAQLTTTVAGLLNPNEVPTLKLLQQGGEMLTKPVRDTWVEGVTLHNGYGPTETTVYTIIRTSLSKFTPCTNIGWPIGRNKVFILNDRLETIPLGAIGELCFGGPQLARGYLNKPDLTEKVFVSSPFTKGERLYKSGDLARFNPDGSITILGRKDNQIKLNGLRIELDEVEHALHQYPELLRASVRLLNVKKNNKNRALVAFLTMKNMTKEDGPVVTIDNLEYPEVTARISKLQDHMRTKLPPYMVPTIWVPLTRFPITTSGKVDLRALEAIYNISPPDHLRSFTQDPKDIKRKPSSPLEEILLSVWADVLNIDISLIGTDDSFYHLGGDSISAIQISSQCRQKGVNVSVQSILLHPTIHQLNNYAEFATEKHIYTTEDEEEGHGLVPLTPIQHQFFGINQTDVNHFHLSWLVKVREPISVSVLQKAIDDLVSHHSMLRVRFKHINGHWEQRILPENENNINVLEYQVSNVKQLRANIYQIQRRLSIEKGPVSSFVLYKLPDGEQLMFMTIHHYLIDLVSWRIIWEDLENILSGQPLSYKSLSFKAWSKLLGMHARSLSLEDYPSQAPIKPLDIDVTKLPLNTMETVNTLSFTLETEHTNLLFGASNDVYRTEAVDFMLSTLAASYCTTFNSQSLTIATEGHGREPWNDSIDVSRTVGWFTSIYPVTIERQPGDTLIDVLKRTKDVRKGIPQHGFTYGLLRYLNEEASKVLRNDQTQVGFNYLGRFQHLEKTGALLQDVDDKYKFDLNLIGPKWRRMNAIETEVTIQHNNLTCSISYSNVLHKEADVNQWLQSWRQSLVELVHVCANKEKGELTVSDLPLLALHEDELNRLINQILPQYSPNLGYNAEDIYPCSPIQEGLIIGNMRSPELYHVQDVYKLVGDLDVDRLISSWKTIIHDLPILRTVFINNPFSPRTSGAYLQIVLKGLELKFQQFAVEKDEINSAVKNYLEGDLIKGFPLGESNIRLCVFHVRNGENRMVISRHHSINDGWSDKIIMNDLSAVYNDTRRPSVIPYKEYIAHRMTENNGLGNDTGADYWVRYLSGTEPCSFPRLGGLSVTKSECLQLTSNAKIVTKDLRNFAKSVGVTLATLVQAAWGLVLQPYYAQEDFIYGVITNGRNMAMKNIDKVIGPCINTLPLRIQYDKEMRVVDLLRRIHLHLLTSIPFQNCGLQKINQWCKSNGNPIKFDSILNFQSLEDDTQGDDQCQLRFELESISEPTEYKLTLNSWTQNGSITFRLDFNSHSVTRTLARHILGRLEVILEAIIKSNNDTQIQVIPKMTESERNLINDFNKSNSEAVVQAPTYTNEVFVHALFEDQVRINPDRVAAQYESSEFTTYNELNKRANRLAHHLIENGIGPDMIVPLCMNKSVSMLVAMLAVMKAGGAYTPLDPKNPVERNLFVINETKSKIVITMDCYKQFFPDQKIISLESEVAFGHHSAENPEVEKLTPSNLCYVLFTSGSTGTPKGVMLEHAAVCSSIWAQKAIWNLNANDSVLQFASYTFDASVVEIFVTLAFGARVSMAPKERLLTDIEDVINSMQITTALLTTTIASYIHPAKVKSLKTLLVGGEMMTVAVRNSWASILDLSNMYGPTEAAVAFLVNHKINEKSSCSNVGKPMESNVIYILDLDLNPVPLGVVGELCVSGPQLARGYLNRPDLTEIAFIPNPFTSGERLYRTGDLARYNVDGSVELLRRKDNQVKLHGLRIELDEIEHAMYEYSKIGRACVLPIVTDSTTDHKSLVAFLTFNGLVDKSSPVALLNAIDTPEAVTHTGEVRELLKKTLPPYMVPTVWVPLSAIPTNSSGKIDRKFVTTIYESISRDDLLSFSASNNTDYVGAVTRVEQDWIQLWAKVLHISEKLIGIHDSFFNLGGDSIVAVRLVGAARQFGYELSVQQLYENLTIAELAANTVLLKSEDKETKPIDKYELLNLKSDELEHLLDVDIKQNGILLSNVEDVYPCSPLQEGLMALGLQDNVSYLNQQLYRCESDIDMDHFKHAWKSVIEANPILRSTIIFSDSGYSHLSGLQVVLGSESIDWNVLDIERSAFSENYLAEILDMDVKKGIHVGHPLTRFTVIRIENSMAYFIWTIHHSLYDGWSMSLMIEDLINAYHLKALSARPSYNNFIKYISDRKKEESLAYWRKVLADAEVTYIAKQSSSAYKDKSSSQLIENINVNFTSITTKHNVTIATIVNLAWSLVMKLHTGSSDVIFGVVNSGRNLPVNGIQEIRGPCFNTLPVRVNLDSELTLLDIMLRIHGSQTEQQRYQSIGLQDLLRSCVDIKTPSLFDSLLVIQNLPTESIASSVASIGLKELSTSMPANYPVVVELIAVSGKRTLALTYDSNVLSEGEAQWIFSHMKTALSEIVKNVNMRVNDLSVISTEESVLLSSWSSNATMQDCNSLIHELFEKQAHLNPDHIALQFETSEFFTYAELNARVNQLAHHLIELGVVPDSTVPLCVDKSVDMIVAMLAILKSGGAYVPLDPNNPVERNRFIISEVKATVVVTFDRYKCYFRGTRIFLLDNEAELLSHQSIKNPVVENLSPSNLCYILFTSGSTGTPKGVMMEHSAVVNFLQASNSIWNLTADDSVLQFANYTFDASVNEIFFPLASGARIAMAPKEILLSNMEETIDKMNVTSLVLTPTIASCIDPAKIPSVKRLILGGEMITTTVRNSWLPYVEIANAYGPTEAAVAILTYLSIDEKTSCSNVGKPMDGNTIRILGLDMLPVPIGVVGELCVSGPQLARGYLNRPDLTKKAFIMNPLATDERLYCTGDLARFNSDGSVELIGRKDNQIKLHGLRIELDEIEHALYGHSKVKRACVLPLVTDQSTNRKSIVAFLAFGDITDDKLPLEILTGSLASIAESHIEELKSQVREHLPPYMVPNIWIPLSAIPTNTSGKIDRNKLSTFFNTLSLEAVVGLSGSSKEKDTTALTSMEITIQRIWSEILNIPASSFSIDDSFYQLGGDSISAIRVSSSSRQNGLSLSVKQIMQNPTIRTQASG
ncbi:hypothetical protein K7432_005451 [Basidiobolus ranarum]|uniref:Carrier domain-containing protein n=1 Tax=Basidiobolus ranarum TaxID=34480 RepID=A0ABR2W337_9FUNG